MGLLKAFACRSSKRKGLTSFHMTANPFRISPAIHHRPDKNSISLSYGNKSQTGTVLERKPVIMFMRLQMDSSVKAEGFNVRIKAGQKIGAKSGLLLLVKMKTVEQVKLGQVEDFNVHGFCPQSMLWRFPGLQSAPCPRQLVYPRVQSTEIPVPLRNRNILLVLPEIFPKQLHRA